VSLFNVRPSPGNAINVLGGSLVVSKGSMTIPQAGSGTVTNYLDIGAATNKPARFYRARLVP